MQLNKGATRLRNLDLSSGVDVTGDTIWVIPQIYATDNFRNLVLALKHVEDTNKKVNENFPSQKGIFVLFQTLEDLVKM